MEKATIAEALEKISDELSQTLDEVERGIYEFGDIDSYESDREQVEWLEELINPLLGAMPSMH